MSAERGSARGARRPWLRRTIAAAAVLYPLALVATTLGLRFVGEAWWVTSVGLYLPRFVLAGPLVLLVPALVALRSRRLLALQAASLWVLLFPLLGFVLPGLPKSRTGDSFRLLSYNVNSVAAGSAAVAARIIEQKPDVVVLEELFAKSPEVDDLVRRLKLEYAVVRASGQFVLASRFPVRSSAEPAGFSFDGKQHSSHCMRYELETPAGPLVVYVVHPVSPRRVINAVRGAGIRRELSSGRLFDGASAPPNRVNAALRELELASAEKGAAKEQLPTIIAGDTNLPGLSPVLHRYFSAYADAFEQAGWGFGYTYPRRLPWMRIDRIMGSHAIEFSSFSVTCGDASDHLCVVADFHLRAG